MDLTLSASDVTRLTAVCAAASAPLSFPSVGEWRRTVRERLVTLLDADRSVSWLHLDGEPPLEAPGGVEAAIAAYGEYYHTVDTGLSQRRRALALEIVPLRSIYDIRQLPKYELWSDWAIPHRLLDALAMTVDVPGTVDPSGFWFYHESKSAPAFGDRGEALLHLALPAVKAGIDTLHRMFAHRADLLTMIDKLPEAVQLVDPAGRVIHENSALADQLTQDPERVRVRDEMQRAARAVTEVMERSRSRRAPNAPAAPVRELRTGAGRLRIVATWLSPGTVAMTGVVMVLLERAAPAPRATDLRSRYRLTSREVEVLGHVRAGESVPELAAHLGISRHTARHHVEALRTKLGVHRVGEIAAMLTSADDGA